MPRSPTLVQSALCAVSLAVAWSGIASPAAAAGGAFADWTFHAMARLEWARGVSGDQKLEVVAEPSFAWRPKGARWWLHGVGRLRVDGFDRMEPGQPPPVERSSLSRQWQLGDRADLELRELVFEAAVGPAYLRLGKQQIVWGEADGLKLLDVVNPQDFREFILPDFDESRIPLWAIQFEVPVGPIVAEFVWLPDPTFHDLPEPGSPFAFTSERLVGRPPAGLPVRIDPPDRPRRLLRDSDAGVRISGQFGGWDLGVAYFFHTDDTPVPAARLEAGPAGPLLRVSPRYERDHLVGATASNAFGDLVVRSEIAWRSDRFLPTGDPAAREGVTRTPELGYVLGLDWFGFTDSLVSLQVFQSWLLEDGPGRFRDTLDTNLTLLVRREFWNERLRVEAIWIHNLNDGDGVLRPKVRYELRDDWTVWAGIDVFYGRSRGLFGQFDHSDRLLVGLEWGI